MESPWKPYLKENILNPYPMYRELRENDPIHRARTGEWIITRYEDAKAILKDDRFKVGNRAEWLEKISEKSTSKHTYPALVEALSSFVVFQNQPDHTALRKLIMQAWNSRAVDQLINESINELLQEVDLHNFDVVSALATPLPIRIMAGILGLPKEDIPRLEQLSHQMMRSLDLYLTLRELEKMEVATQDFTTYFERLAQEKLTNPDDGLLSRLVLINKEQKLVPHHVLLANCFFLFIAGSETTTGLIGPGLLNLVTHHKYSTSLRDPHLSKTATDELLRFDAPTQLVGRMASEKISIGDFEFEEGSLLTVCLGSANRDPQKFEHADELILDRNPNHHLAFSTGVHRCIGDWLARREFELLLQRLAAGYKTIEVVDEPVWKENFNFRCLQSLQISCTA